MAPTRRPSSSSRAPVAKKRISFTDYEACHLYEWLVHYWGNEPHFGHCALCQQLGGRLERFIGQPEVRRIKRVMKRGLAVRTRGRLVRPAKGEA